MVIRIADLDPCEKPRNLLMAILFYLSTILFFKATHMTCPTTQFPHVQHKGIYVIMDAEYMLPIEP